MNDIKAIFIDFDWTIYDHKSHSIPKSCIDALNKAKQNGVKVFLNSARTYYSLLGMEIVKLVDFDAFGVINGCASFTKDKLLHAHFLEQDDASEVIKICEANHLSYLISTLENTYIKANKNDPCVKRFYEVFSENYPLDISLYNKKDKLIAIQVFFEEDKDHLFNNLKSDIVLHRFFDTVVEFNKIENHKKDATKAIMEHYNLNKDECMAIGDDLNDIDMFHSVKYSVCMGNGNELAKENASYITKSIEDDGIYHALIHFKVI